LVDNQIYAPPFVIAFEMKDPTSIPSAAQDAIWVLNNISCCMYVYDILYILFYLLVFDFLLGVDVNDKGRRGSMVPTLRECLDSL